MYENGAPWTGDRLHDLAAAAGLVPVGSVTKKGCNLLVAVRHGTPLATVIGTGMCVLGVVLTLAILSHAVLS